MTKNLNSKSLFGSGCPLAEGPLPEPSGGLASVASHSVTAL